MHGTLRLKLKKVWTPKLNERLIELIDGGLSSAEIAAEMGLTYSAIITRARRIGRPFPRQGETWPPERIERLRQLWDSKLSCAQIAKELGVTKNAIIGKRNRLCLPTRLTTPFGDFGPSQGPIKLRTPSTAEQTIERQRAATRRYRARSRELLPARPPKAPTPLWKSMETAEPPSATRCTLMELNTHTCRWPYGEPAHDSLYCGAKPVAKQPYCAHHMRIAYTSGPYIRPDRRPHYLKNGGYA